MAAVPIALRSNPRSVGAGVRRMAGVVAPFVLFFGGWQLLMAAGPHSLQTVLASPSTTVSYIAHNHSEMLTALRTTAYEALIGYLVGNLAGFVLAFVLDSNRQVGHVGLALMVVAQSVPVIAFSAVFA